MAKANRATKRRLHPYLLWGLVGVLISVLLGAAFLWPGRWGAGKTVQFEHLHGLGYSPDGQRLLLAAHDGLRVYANGEWIRPDTPGHDFMGFAPVNDGFYASGHPAPGSNLPDPLGLVKSTDEGATLKTLGLGGEADFHVMAAGYQSRVLYAINTVPNSRMASPGLYFTADEGKTWVKSAMNSLPNEAITAHNAWVALAVHPTNSAVVAVGADSGLYLSTDRGHRFQPVLPQMPVTALAFTQKGTLLVAGYKNGPFLYEMDLADKQSRKLRIPLADDDTIVYLAPNPVREGELAVATYHRDVYLTRDQGLNWIQIADQGEETRAPSSS
ncbi:F510_1955 family glycosylhydrolase [Calditerricola satsumensis]|uniref:Sortilin N-terminal domain-containing protein n=1 Tax=Calditerricola satsumensis TaxID=373054 RepID=A0A8J3B5D5_9BACI|nr:hypothetical protein [Calditerricola satsumensis]GGJ96730.1 hypothetical protein GCM10007043_08160 [Calditerricola satsumensis]